MIRARQYGSVGAVGAVAGLLVAMAPSAAGNASVMPDGQQPVGTTVIVSRNSDGDLGDDDSHFAELSGDGRYVAFASDAHNFAPRDTRFYSNTFVRDLRTGTTLRVDRSYTGGYPDFETEGPSISNDAKVLAYSTYASNIVPGDTNDRDIFAVTRPGLVSTLVSETLDGQPGMRGSGLPEVSGDGRYISWGSKDDNLVEGDTDGMWDVFIFDRETGTTSLVSRTSEGAHVNEFSNGGAMNRDGRYVGFSSDADALAPGETVWNDAFLLDRTTGELTLISRTATGEPANRSSSIASISDNGRYVAWTSYSAEIVDGDVNGFSDVFLLDRRTGTTTLVSRTPAGVPGNASSSQPDLSGDGRFVAYTSSSSDIVPGDDSDKSDIFVFDRVTQTTRRITYTYDGGQPHRDSYAPDLSADGRYLAFSSGAPDLVRGDTNSAADVFVHRLS